MKLIALCFLLAGCATKSYAPPGAWPLHAKTDRHDNTDCHQTEVLLVPPMPLRTALQERELLAHQTRTQLAPKVESTGPRGS